MSGGWRDGSLTYFFKRVSVLSQCLLTENAVLCQKVNCKEKKERAETTLSCRREICSLTEPASVRIRTMFPSSGHTGVMDGGQYKARASQGDHLALMGGGNGRGDNSTWLNRCWRLGSKDLEINYGK